MLDKDFVAPKKEATEYTPLPEDIYQVELLDVSSSRNVTYDTRNSPDDEKEYETVMKFQFVLLEGKDGEEDLRGRSVWQNFVPAILYIGKKGKNKLYQIVEALQGETVSPEQEATGITGEMLNALIGKQCRVGIANQVKGDKTYSNIDKFLAAKEQLAPLTAEEKDKATVKEDKEAAANAAFEGEAPAESEEELNKADIPF